MEALGLSGSIRLVAQPANSPDVNINDLGFVSKARNGQSP